MLACVSMRDGCLILKVIDNEGAARLIQRNDTDMLVVGQYVLELASRLVITDCVYGGPQYSAAIQRTTLPIMLHNTTLEHADHIDVAPKDHLKLVRLQRDILATLLYASRQTSRVLRLATIDYAAPDLRRIHEHMLLLSDTEFMGFSARRL